MFNHLATLPADPLLGLMSQYRADNRENKLDLGVGVYKDDQGKTPLLESVKRAQLRHVQQETTKSYLNPFGTPEFIGAMSSLVLGKGHKALIEDRVSLMHTPGGCGALRVAAELLARSNKDVCVWVSDPTWANHIPLMQEAGITIKTYPYYDAEHQKVRFDEMMETLKTVPKDDVVLLHGCCHNPCGADLSREQWQALADLAQKNGFVPFIDIAYQGFGEGIEEDAWGLRLLAERLPEMLIAVSCSKNFGLYRERTGALFVVSETAQQMNAVKSQLANVARGIYSMPPAHGASIVENILLDDALNALWVSEVNTMRERIKRLRRELAAGMAATDCQQDFSFITRENGMFSFLGLSQQQVLKLRSDFGIYMADSSRVNIAGIQQALLPYLCEAITSVTQSPE